MRGITPVNISDVWDTAGAAMLAREIANRLDVNQDQLVEALRESGAPVDRVSKGIGDTWAAGDGLRFLEFDTWAEGYGWETPLNRPAVATAEPEPEPAATVGRDVQDEASDRVTHASVAQAVRALREWSARGVTVEQPAPAGLSDTVPVPVTVVRDVLVSIIRTASPDTDWVAFDAMRGELVVALGLADAGSAVEG